MAKKKDTIPVVNTAEIVAHVAGTEPTVEAGKKDPILTKEAMSLYQKVRDGMTRVGLTWERLNFRFAKLGRMLEPADIEELYVSPDPNVPSDSVCPVCQKPSAETSFVAKLIKDDGDLLAFNDKPAIEKGVCKAVNVGAASHEFKLDVHVFCPGDSQLEIKDKKGKVIHATSFANANSKVQAVSAKNANATAYLASIGANRTTHEDKGFRGSPHARRQDPRPTTARGQRRGEQRFRSVNEE